eukprot:UN20900
MRNFFGERMMFDDKTFQTQEGIFRQVKNPLGFSKIHDQLFLLLEKNTKQYNHFGDIWTIPQSWYFAYESDVKSIHNIISHAQDEIFLEKDGIHSGRGVTPMYGKDIKSK